MGRKCISKLQNKTKNQLKGSAFSRYSTGDHTFTYFTYYTCIVVLVQRQ
jgi:hypothetical protein